MAQVLFRSMPQHFAHTALDRLCSAPPWLGPTWLRCIAPIRLDRLAATHRPLPPPREFPQSHAADQLLADTSLPLRDRHSCSRLRHTLANAPPLDACKPPAADHPRTRNPR